LRQWYIPPEIWKSEICSGLDPIFVARTLAERGLIEKPRDGFQKPTRINGDLKRVYVVTARILAGGDDDA
jgi:putative DNA primase/helicase